MSETLRSALTGLSSRTGFNLEIFRQNREILLATIGVMFVGLANWGIRPLTVTRRLARSGLFLLSQLGLIFAARVAGLPTGRRLAGLPGDLVAIALLAGYAIVASREEPRRPSKLASLFFGGYILYWFMEKYDLPSKLYNSILAASTTFAPILSDGGAVSIVGVSFIGVSYIGFKLIHFFVDYRAGEIKDPSPIEILSWLLFYPSITAGPMQRFQDWQSQRRDSHLTIDDVSEGIRRLVIGMILKFALADSIFSLTIANMGSDALHDASAIQLVFAAACYSFYLYWDFSGYSHMAIGLGRFFAIRLPENFNWPFISRNLAEFWQRWHITLSHLLRDYIFYPLSLRMKRTSRMRRHPNLAAALPPLITFLIAGLWHGAAFGFVVFGALHGLGLAFLAVAARHPSRSAFARWWANSVVARLLATVFTFAYVTVTLLFFCLSTDHLAILGERLLSIF